MDSYGVCNDIYFSLFVEYARIDCLPIEYSGSC